VFRKRIIARCQMRPRNASLTLGLQVAPSLPTPSRRKKLQAEPAERAREPQFQRPPVWIHASVAGFLAPGRRRREARRREVLALLDRIPLSRGDK
jgi:hypothetical protein